jgi:hypothetical protein
MINAQAPRFRVSLNRMAPGEKVVRGDSRHAQYHGSFQPETHTPGSLFAAIKEGYAFCAELLVGDCGREHHGQRWCCQECREKGDPTHCGRPDGYRHSYHFKSSQVLALDDDSRNLSIDELLADPFIAEYASFVYPTISWMPENRKWRIVFILSEPITEPGVYRKAATALLGRYGTTDQQVKDPARLFFGMKPGSGEAVFLGNVLPMTEVMRLVSEYDDRRRELEQEVRRRQLPEIDWARITGNSRDERYISGAIEAEKAWLSSRPAGAGERYPSVIPAALHLESLRLSDWLNAEARSQINVADVVLVGCAANGALNLYGEAHLRKAIDWGVMHAEPRPQPPNWENGHQPLFALNTLNAQLSTTPAQPKWPDSLAPEAFMGLAGDIVRAIAPHTEADPAALLVNFLVAFGNAVGTGPHAIAEADRHGTNLFVTLVGATSKGRKGSSWGHIRELFRRADPEWIDNRIMGGLSSGEGLLWAVRDPIEKTEVLREKGKPTGQTVTYEADPGSEDKRLLVVEPEFASVLQVMGREKNTLSAILRQAWDSTGVLRTMTKNSPVKATGAHVSILGHVTKDELLRHLTETEAANGFGNRFLWICAKRAQFLPEGGEQPDYNSLVSYLHNALDLARRMGTLQRDDQARAVWADIYPELSGERPGLFGNITNRAEAQVLRLSVLYAALDGDRWIRLPHLEAALGVWQYAESSARWIFGDKLGDEVADRILDALAHGEMDRTALYYLFGKHVKSERISTTLAMLRSIGRVNVEVRESDGGRPREVWMLA